jgi:hypothetical protein
MSDQRNAIAMAHEYLEPSRICVCWDDLMMTNPWLAVCLVAEGWSLRRHVFADLVKQHKHSRQRFLMHGAACGRSDLLADTIEHWINDIPLLQNMLHWAIKNGHDACAAYMIPNCRFQLFDQRLLHSQLQVFVHRMFEKQMIVSLDQLFIHLRLTHEEMRVPCMSHLKRLCQMSEVLELMNWTEGLHIFYKYMAPNLSEASRRMFLNNLLSAGALQGVCHLLSTYRLFEDVSWVEKKTFAVKLTLAKTSDMKHLREAFTLFTQQQDAHRIMQSAFDSIVSQTLWEHYDQDGMFAAIEQRLCALFPCISFLPTELHALLQCAIDVRAAFLTRLILRKGMRLEEENDVMLALTMENSVSAKAILSYLIETGHAISHETLIDFLDRGCVLDLVSYLRRAGRVQGSSNKARCGLDLLCGVAAERKDRVLCRRLLWFGASRLAMGGHLQLLAPKQAGE